HLFEERLKPRAAANFIEGGLRVQEYHHRAARFISLIEREKDLVGSPVERGKGSQHKRVVSGYGGDLRAALIQHRAGDTLFGFFESGLRLLPPPRLSDGFIKMPGLQEQPAGVDIDAHRERIERERLSQCGQSFFAPADCHEKESPIVMREREAWVIGDG